MRIVHVTVKPNSKKGPLVVQDTDGLLVLYIRQPAIDGKANVATIELLAHHFGVAKSRVTLKSGHTSRHKVFTIRE